MKVKPAMTDTSRKEKGSMVSRSVIAARADRLGSVRATPDPQERGDLLFLLLTYVVVPVMLR